MAVERVLVLGGEVAVLVQIRSVLDAVLLECEVQLAITQGVAAQRDDGVAAAEEAVVDGNEVRLAGGVVDVNVLDAANLVAVDVVSGSVCQVLDAVEVSHDFSLKISASRFVVPRVSRLKRSLREQIRM